MEFGGKSEPVGGIGEFDHPLHLGREADDRAAVPGASPRGNEIHQDADSRAVDEGHRSKVEDELATPSTVVSGGAKGRAAGDVELASDLDRQDRGHAGRTASAGVSRAARTAG